MRLSVEWEDGGRTSEDIDLLAVGALRLLVGNTNVCESRVGGGGRTSDSIPVSV